MLSAIRAAVMVSRMLMDGVDRFDERRSAATDGTARGGGAREGAGE